jgi:hypothetical protein
VYTGRRGVSTPRRGTGITPDTGVLHEEGLRSRMGGLTGSPLHEEGRSRCAGPSTGRRPSRGEEVALRRGAGIQIAGRGRPGSTGRAELAWREILWERNVLLMGMVRTTLRVLGCGWIVAALAAPGLSGMVLCMGADGHLELEPAHHDGCRSLGHDVSVPASTGPAPTGDAERHEGPEGNPAPAGADQGATSHIHPEDDCCGDCVDVPVAPDAAPHLVKRRSVDRVAQQGSTGTGPGDRIPVGTPRFGLDTGASSQPQRIFRGISPSLTSQRSVVLRT